MIVGGALGDLDCGGCETCLVLLRVGEVIEGCIGVDTCLACCEVFGVGVKEVEED